MHIEAMDFVRRVKLRFPEYFKNKNVLEVGSLNINGSVRQFFENCQYIGIDRIPGKDVDIVGPVHDCAFKEKFDIIISTEAFEHDEYLEKTIEKMVNSLGENGLIIVTTANINRKPHLEGLNENSYYQNISKEMVISWIKKYQMHALLEEDSGQEDIRFVLTMDPAIYESHPEKKEDGPYKLESIMKVMKEISKESETIKPYVIVAQPRRDLKEIPAQKLDGMGLHIDFLGFSRGFINIDGEAVDVARNYLIEESIESDAKYLFFVGEDTVIPWDGFIKLHEIAEKNPYAMVVGVYYMKISSPMIMLKKDGYIVPANVDPGQVFEAYSAGLDCALIPIALLKKMKEKDPDVLFCSMSNMFYGMPFIGEDTFFHHRFQKMGYKLLVNTDVQCLHIDLATGKYTAHPSVNLNNYFTNIQITRPLTIDDKTFIDKRWHDRLPMVAKGGSNARDK